MVSIHVYSWFGLICCFQKIIVITHMQTQMHSSGVRGVKGHMIEDYSYVLA